MKVLLVNGSSNLKGCTYTALSEVAGVLEQNGIETEFVQLGNGPIRDCIGCGACRNNGGVCAFNEDDVNAFIQKAKEADGFVFGSPVYYAHPSGRLLSFMDRAFFAGKKNFAYKPAAAVVSGRRAGTTGSVDVITKHFTVSNMPVVPSNYWNMVHGSKPEDVRQDLEGMQTMRNLGLNMAWMLKCIEAGKKTGVSLPVAEEKIWTNFIR